MTKGTVMEKYFVKYEYCLNNTVNNVITATDANIMPATDTATPIVRVIMFFLALAASDALAASAVFAVASHDAAFSQSIFSIRQWFGVLRENVFCQHLPV